MPIGVQNPEIVFYFPFCTVVACSKNGDWQVSSGFCYRHNSKLSYRRLRIHFFPQVIGNVRPYTREGIKSNTIPLRNR